MSNDECRMSKECRIPKSQCGGPINAIFTTFDIRQLDIPSTFAIRDSTFTQMPQTIPLRAQMKPTPQTRNAGQAIRYQNHPETPPVPAPRVLTDGCGVRPARINDSRPLHSR